MSDNRVFYGPYPCRGLRMDESLLGAPLPPSYANSLPSQDVNMGIGPIAPTPAERRKYALLQATATNMEAERSYLGDKGCMEVVTIKTRVDAAYALLAEIERREK